MTREGRRGEQQEEAGSSIWNVRHGSVYEGICTTDEGLLHQVNARIVKYPHAQVVVRSDDVNGVHDAYR
jgi:hypothetical protein